jgi:titin
MSKYYFNISLCLLCYLAVLDVLGSSQAAANMEQLHALEARTALRAKGRLEDDEFDHPDNDLVNPSFLTKPRSLENLREGQRAHFEAKLEPITDPNLQVEWLKDGQPVIVGHRFRPIHDFGYVALDIIDTISDDSGTYTCRATNLAGTCQCQVQLKCHSKI